MLLSHFCRLQIQLQEQVYNIIAKHNIQLCSFGFCMSRGMPYFFIVLGVFAMSQVPKLQHKQYQRVGKLSLSILAVRLLRNWKHTSCSHGRCLHIHTYNTQMIKLTGSHTAWFAHVVVPYASGPDVQLLECLQLRHCYKEHLQNGAAEESLEDCQNPAKTCCHCEEMMCQKDSRVSTACRW